MIGEPIHVNVSVKLLRCGGEWVSLTADPDGLALSVVHGALFLPTTRSGKAMALCVQSCTLSVMERWISG
jgi:hypothetical protein